jgi:hypothetical protein
MVLHPFAETVVSGHRRRATTNRPFFPGIDLSEDCSSAALAQSIEKRTF